MTNLIDKTVSFFSPEAGLKREQARAKLEIVRDVRSGKRSFDGATKSRRGDTFGSGGSRSQNLDIQKSLILLRERSIDGYKNNPNVFRAIRTIQNNVVGTGIMPTPVAVAGEPELTKAELKIVKSKWEWFVKNCDWDGVFNFWGLQGLSMRNVGMQGEIFVVRQRDVDNPVPFKLQVLGPHMVDHSKNSLITTERPDHFVIQGVEFDGRGRKVGYWMHEFDPKNEFVLKLAPKFVSVDDVIQVFYKEWPEQVRGIPFGTSAMLNMRDLADFEDAALIGMKIAACHVAFTTQEKPDTADMTLGDDYDDRGDHLEPGAITYLNPGEEVTFNTPPTPANFDAFVTKNQQKNAAAFLITYEQMTGDMSNVNFSSGRMGWIEAQRQIEDWQYNFFIPQFCEKIWTWFIDGLIAKRDIKRRIDAEWTPQGREMLDPVKEMNGLILELKSGLISWTEACKRRGYNPDVLFEQIKKDRKLFEDAGVDVEWIVKNEAAIAENPGAPVDGGKLDSEELKRVFDAYGVAVRAGVITPTPADEEHFRGLAQLPEMGDAVIAAWKEEGGIRRPITITPLPVDDVDPVAAAEANPDISEKE